YVASANVHRRHLTVEQKRELIAKLLKADPSKSDRQIAETAKASPTTVGTVRTEMEAKGDVSKLDTRRDRRGRKQPAKRERTHSPDVGPPGADVQAVRDAAAKRIRALRGQPEPPARDDIGADSMSEAERLRVRVEELQAEVRQRDI